MATITSGSFSKLLYPGLNAIFGKSYNDWDEQWSQIFDKNTSRKAFEEDISVSSFGLAAQRAEGAPITYDTESQGFLTRYQHVEYGLGFIITRNMYEDDQYDYVGEKRSKALARSLRLTKETVGANVLNRAFSGSYVGGDGVPLISASHPNVAGGTWSNQIAVAADLSEAALEQASIDIMGFTDDRGLKIMVKPQKLIVPKELTFEAARLLETEGRPGTANNDLNALKSKGVFKELAINQYLTDPDAWFIKTDAPDGLKYFERRAMEFVNEPDFDTDNAKYKATERYSFGWSDARACYGSAGA